MSIPIPVESSLLSSVAYAHDGTLRLQFRSGAIYHYLAVPRVVFESLLAAPSKGEYFNRSIRDHFQHQRLA